MDNELELITSYRLAVERANELHVKLHYAKAAEKSVLEKKLQYTLSLKRKLTKELIEIQEIPYTEKKREALENFFRSLLKALSHKFPGYTVSRNQGMILHNYIFGKIMHDIRWVFDGDHGTIPVPDFYYERSSFDVQPLKDLLSQTLMELEKLKIRNYIQLEQFIDKTLNSIRELSKDDEV